MSMTTKQDHSGFLLDELTDLGNPQTDIPRIAKDENLLSKVESDEDHKQWFQSIWSGITGASTRSHPEPYPEELAEPLIRMFSFVGDTVLDPFMGTGTTIVAAAKWGRSSIGVEFDLQYFESAEKRIHDATNSLFSYVEINATA